MKQRKLKMIAGTSAMALLAAGTCISADVASAQTTAPAQTTSAPAGTVKTDANGKAQTGSLKTGDTAPLFVCGLCMLSGCTALLCLRKRRSN